jgi:hypothetical protein
MAASVYTADLSFFGYGLFILDQVLKYVIRFWRINGLMKKPAFN